MPFGRVWGVPKEFIDRLATRLDHAERHVQVTGRSRHVQRGRERDTRSDVSDVDANLAARVRHC